MQSHCTPPEACWCKIMAILPDLVDPPARWNDAATHDWVVGRQTSWLDNEGWTACMLGCLCKAWQCDHSVAEDDVWHRRQTGSRTHLLTMNKLTAICLVVSVSGTLYECLYGFHTDLGNVATTKQCPPPSRQSLWAVFGPISTANCHFRASGQNSNFVITYCNSNFL